MTLSITTLFYYACYILFVIILKGIKLSIIMPNAVMLSVIAPLEDRDLLNWWYLVQHLKQMFEGKLYDSVFNLKNHRIDNI
jgi:hypothetical protein